MERERGAQKLQKFTRWIALRAEAHPQRRQGRRNTRNGRDDQLTMKTSNARCDTRRESSGAAACTLPARQPCTVSGCSRPPRNPSENTHKLKTRKQGARSGLSPAVAQSCCRRCTDILWLASFRQPDRDFNCCHPHLARHLFNCFHGRVSHR